MCCQEPRTFDLPPEVIEAQETYRRMRAERGWDWGDEQVPDMFRWARFSLFGAVMEAVDASGDWPAAIRRVIGDDVPTGVVMVRVAADGSLTADRGPARPAIVGRTVPIDVVVDSRLERAIDVSIGTDRTSVAPFGASIFTIDVEGSKPVIEVVVDGRMLRIDRAVTSSASAMLRVSSSCCARWSITDSTGGAWFPDGAMRKWDAQHRPFFHAREAEVVVPAEHLNVACARGLEFERIEVDVHPVADEVTEVACDPQRLFDPAAHGWYGGDLHIHMNYSGDLVCAPADAARMQVGEGLHLANFVAANLTTSMVYDQDMLEQYIDTDLPWSGDLAVARMGVEFRNDLFGHVHALGPSSVPSAFYTGYERSDHDEDWPPNSVACEELRSLGASVGYAHPAMSPFGDDWSMDRFFSTPRSVEARELVADAALGLVDSVDVISPFDDEGAVFLYHRLLSCGLRLAATAGTDTFLSFAHGPGVASNPPGWGRVYAHLDGEPLSVAAFKAAIRAGRTTVTNGPWLTLEVDGKRPGAVLNCDVGDALDVIATLHAPGADTLRLVGPDGDLADADGTGELRTRVTVEGPTWLAAVARGPGNSTTLDAAVLAHTSPVYIDVDNERVGRGKDAAWCLAFLDRLQTLVTEHGHFHSATRDQHLADFIDTVDAARSYYRSVATRTSRVR